jgi:hypothetical protein
MKGDLYMTKQELKENSGVDIDSIFGNENFKNEAKYIGWFEEIDGDQTHKVACVVEANTEGYKYYEFIVSKDLSPDNVIDKTLKSDVPIFTDSIS